MIFYYRSVGTALLITSLAATSAYSLECPQPQLKSSPGVIIETPADIVSSSQILANGGSNAISTMIFRLRQRNPRSSDGAILNYLLTAYCPVVNRMSGVSENQKRAKLKLFKHQAMTNLPF
jgi:hypothetical protein